MHCEVVFRHMDPSPALRNYARQLVQEGIRRLVPAPAEAHVVFSKERQRKQATCHVVAANGLNVAVRESGTDAYETLERVVEKLVRQVRHRQAKRRGRPRRRQPVPLAV